MYFNDDFDATLAAKAAYVVHAMENISTARAPMQATINALTPETYTPLSETLYEAAHYYSGGAVVFGNPDSVAASREPGNPALYNSPIDIQLPEELRRVPDRRRADRRRERRHRHRRDARPRRRQLRQPGRRHRATSRLTRPASIRRAASASTISPNSCTRATSRPYRGSRTSRLTRSASRSTCRSSPTRPRAAAVEYYTANDTATLATALQKIVQAILTNDTTFTAPTRRRQRVQPHAELERSVHQRVQARC